MKNGAMQVMSLLGELKNLRSRLTHLEVYSPALLRKTARQVRHEEDWNDVFDTLTDMITIHDMDFNIIDANRAAREVFGLPDLSSGGVKCYRFYHGTDAPPSGCPSCRCLETGVPASFELYEPHLNRHIEIRAIPRFDRKNRPSGLIHVVRDISARRRVEEELQIHRNHLEWLVTERTAAMAESNQMLRREIEQRALAEKDRERLIRELQEALESIKTLRGLLPMCAWCRRIRDEGGDWKTVETYLNEHTEASFTHGICPECAKTFDEDLKNIMQSREGKPKAGRGDSLPCRQEPPAQ